MENNLQITKKRRIGLWVTINLIGLIIVAVLAGVSWYFHALKPVDLTDTTQHRFMVAQGASTDQVAQNLRDEGLIKNTLAYRIYAKLNNTLIEAGAHSLSPSMSSQQIAQALSQADTNEVAMTIPPGLTLDELRTVFKEYGFSDNEITTAYNASYDSPLFNDKPDDASLEGYIYPETYHIFAGDSLEVLLQKSFDEFYRTLQDGDLASAFADNGLTLNEAITLASIVQKEVPTAEDQRMVAGVFFNRLEDGMPLGADATFFFAAKKMGVTPSPTLDSPYNTRIYAGLPPGPISNVGYSALEAVAHPTRSNYFYFVSGDDGTTHFAVTEAEHLENTANYCTILCQ